MRIMFLNKAPKNSAKYDVTSVEKLLNSYASEGTRVEVHFPGELRGFRGGRRNREPEDAQWARSHDGDAVVDPEDLLGGGERL